MIWVLLVDGKEVGFHYDIGELLKAAESFESEDVRITFFYEDSVEITETICSSDNVAE